MPGTNIIMAHGGAKHTYQTCDSKVGVDTAAVRLGCSEDSSCQQVSMSLLAEAAATDEVDETVDTGPSLLAK